MVTFTDPNQLNLQPGTNINLKIISTNSLGDSEPLLITSNEIVKTFPSKPNTILSFNPSLTKSTPLILSCKARNSYSLTSQDKSGPGQLLFLLKK